jgi:hypothetical protein
VTSLLALSILYWIAAVALLYLLWRRGRTPDGS